LWAAKYVRFSRWQVSQEFPISSDYKGIHHRSAPHLPRRKELLVQQLWRVIIWGVPLPITYQDTWKQIAKYLNTAINLEYPKHYNIFSLIPSLEVFVFQNTDVTVAFIINGNFLTIVKAQVFNATIGYKS